MKKILITLGPIPGKLDSVKVITNNFKGRLGQKTVEDIANKYHDINHSHVAITVVCHEKTELDPRIESKASRVIRIKDVHDYVCQVLNCEQQDMYILSAAVANLIPERVIEGKFPSHNYKEGDVINIPFIIAPRLVDRIKVKYPKSTLIAYKLFDGTHEELIKAAKLLQKESKADMVFANNPKEVMTKYFLNKEGAVVEMSFEEHIAMICHALNNQHYSTDIEKEVDAITLKETEEIIFDWMKLGITTNKYGETHGSYAWKLDEKSFVTTTRGHTQGTSLVANVCHKTLKIKAQGVKPCPLAPVYDAIFKFIPESSVIIHTHEEIGKADYVIPYNTVGTRSLTLAVMRGIKRLEEMHRMPKNEIVFKLQHHGHLIVYKIIDEKSCLKAENQMKLFSITGVFE